MRLIFPSQRTKVTIKSRCSAVKCAKGPPVNCPSMDVSQDGQCKRVTVNSPRQTGQRVGAAYMEGSPENQLIKAGKAYNQKKGRTFSVEQRNPVEIPKLCSI